VFLAYAGNSFYAVTLVLQIAFYAVAGLGYIMRARKIRLKGFFVPYYFFVMNAAVYYGLLKYLSGRQTVIWEKSERAS
jgi:hypothetical protein